jgi:hypothetical protein
LLPHPGFKRPNGSSISKSSAHIDACAIAHAAASRLKAHGKFIMVFLKPSPQKLNALPDH